MILTELIRRVAVETGLPIDTPEGEQAVIDLINDAGQQLWDQTDLPRCLMEEVFTIDTTDPVPRLTLPSRVGELRGIRRPQGKVSLHDVRPRYNDRPWPQDNLMTFRVLYETPIARSIDNAIGLYMPPIANFEGPLSVYIVGATDTAKEFHASFDLNGEGTAQGVLWTDIFSITKTEPTPLDIILYAGDDDTGDEMARLGTYEYRSKYTVIELHERPFIGNGEPDTVQSSPLEILYKPPFRPLLEPTSCFQLDGYDHVIIYGAVKIYRIRGIGGDATETQINAAKVHAIRADEVLKQKINAKIQGQDIVIQFGKPRGDIRRLRGIRHIRYCP